jgi:hypothetical protein
MARKNWEEDNNLRIFRKPPENNGIRIVPKNFEQKLTIVKKETGGKTDRILFLEWIHKVYTIAWKKLPHRMQRTPANCWPLSIINGLYALEPFCDFDYPQDFPKTSQKIRELLSGDVELRHAENGWYYEKNQVSWNNNALFGSVMYNLVNTIKWIRVLWAGFATGVNSKVVDINNKDQILDDSDWIILMRGFHYISYVKNDWTNWICVDSTKAPYIIIDQNLKNLIGDNPRFLAMKKAEKIQINRK